MVDEAPNSRDKARQLFTELLRTADASRRRELAPEIIQILGAGGLVAVPSYAELAGPAAADVATYFQAANADAATRIKLFRLAFDAAVSSFSGRQQLYERYYSGDPVRLAGTLYSLYDKDTHIDRIVAMLDDLEAHPPPPAAGEG